jgi:oxygen-independent coproporphyrinogen-3 oxidase
MMGLRLADGVDVGQDAAGLQPRLQHLSELGLVETAGPRIRVTPKGRPLLNAILRDLLA